MRIIVVSTLACLLTFPKPASDSTGKRGVRERRLLLGNLCEPESVLDEYTDIHLFFRRNGLTFSELGHTPPFPLERFNFPMDFASQDNPPGIVRFICAHLTASCEGVCPWRSSVSESSSTTTLAVDIRFLSKGLSLATRSLGSLTILN